MMLYRKTLLQTSVAFCVHDAYFADQNAYLAIFLCLCGHVVIFFELGAAGTGHVMFNRGCDWPRFMNGQLEKG